MDAVEQKGLNPGGRIKMGDKEELENEVREAGQGEPAQNAVGFSPVAYGTGTVLAHRALGPCRPGQGRTGQLAEERFSS